MGLHCHKYRFAALPVFPKARYTIRSWAAGLSGRHRSDEARRLVLVAVDYRWRDGHDTV